MGAKDAREAQSYSSLFETKTKKVKERCCFLCGRTFTPQGPSRHISSRIYCYDPECERKRETACKELRKKRNANSGKKLHKKRAPPRVMKSFGSVNLEVGQTWKVISTKGVIRHVEIMAFAPFRDGRNGVVAKILWHSESPNFIGKNTKFAIEMFSDTAMFYPLTKEEACQSPKT